MGNRLLLPLLLPCREAVKKRHQQQAGKNYDIKHRNQTKSFLRQVQIKDEDGKRRIQKNGCCQRSEQCIPSISQIGQE